jgi:hypothetical protein
MSVLCECKSLSGSNLIFSGDKAPLFHRDEPERYWIGYETELRSLIRHIAKDAGADSGQNLQALHKYAIDRAYGDDGRAVIASVEIPSPPISMSARAFRETKSGESQGDANQEFRGPVWNTILGLLSSMRAAKERSSRSSLSYIDSQEISFVGVDEFTRNAAFFLDAQLMRINFFHAIIVVKSKLWCASQDDFKQISSCRLFINDFTESVRYVDIVSEESAKEYISNLSTHIAASAKRSIAALWREVDRRNWWPGQVDRDLFKALHLKRERRQRRRRTSDGGR